MARVYAHAIHYYIGERHQEYVFPAGEWRDVPDDVADILCAAHPQKLVRLRPNENRPGEASLPSVEAPPEPERESEPEPEPEPAEAPEPVKAVPEAGTVEKPVKYSWLKKREPKRGK